MLWHRGGVIKSGKTSLTTPRINGNGHVGMVVAAIATLILCAWSIGRTEAANRYRAPFDVEKQRAAWGHPLPPLANCPAPSPAVADLTHIIFYSDRAQSVVDREKLRQQMAQTESIRRFAGSLNRMADEYVMSVVGTAQVNGASAVIHGAVSNIGRTVEVR